VTALATVLNVFNSEYQGLYYGNTNINATYSYERNEDGTPVNSFGKPYGYNFGRPRETRFSLRVSF
jgi:hypothetical protein